MPWAALPEAQPDFLFSQTATAAGGWGGVKHAPRVQAVAAAELGSESVCL